jgi:predicted Zn-dependent protease
MLTSRSHWKNLPPGFLAEIVARLQSKENVIRFVSLAEGYGFVRKDLPAIAKNRNLEAAMREVACWLEKFGDGLQKENRFKEAEFVQRLAFGLQPDQYFTELPLAVSYYKMERYADAVPLFKKGLARLEKLANGAKPMGEASLSVDGSRPAANLAELRAGYQELYAACVKAAGLGGS